VHKSAEQNLRDALAVAYRHYDAPTTTDAERESILRSIAVTMPDAEAEAASRMLHHLSEARAHQLLLKGLLEGVR